MGTTRQKSSCRNRLQNGPRLLSRVKMGTHSPLPTGSHTAAYTPKQGLFRMGALLLPSERFTRFGNPAWPGVRTANFAAFGSWSEALLKDTESLRNSDALLCASLFRGVAAPLGCVICLQLGDAAVFSLCAQYFLNVRGGGGITTLGAFHAFRKPCVARYQNGKLCRFWGLVGDTPLHL